MYPTCICGENNYKVILNFKKGKKKYKILLCKNCGLARTWPIPFEGKTTPYQKEKSYLERKEKIKLWQRFAKSSISRIKKYKKEGRLLDVGCNLGIFVKEAQKAGFDAYGIDPSRYAIKEGEKLFRLSGKLLHGSLTTISFPENYFDIVTLIHSLEHIHNLNFVLKKIYSILKKDGILLIEVPNFNSLWRKLLGERWYGFYFQQHVWQFTSKSLQSILKRHKFSILKIDTRHSMYHRLSFNLIGLIKLLIFIIAYILKIGDNLVIIAKK